MHFHLALLAAARAAPLRDQARHAPALAARRPVPTGAAEVARRSRPAPVQPAKPSAGDP
jgi:hypothetical protein